VLICNGIARAKAVRWTARRQRSGEGWGAGAEWSALSDDARCFGSESDFGRVDQIGRTTIGAVAACAPVSSARIAQVAQ
jgi:hypothetical protein